MKRYLDNRHLATLPYIFYSIYLKVGFRVQFSKDYSLRDNLNCRYYMMVSPM